MNTLFSDPQSRGQLLLSLGAGLLNASGPSQYPTSTGQAIGQGLLNMQNTATNLQALQQRDQHEKDTLQLYRDKMSAEQEEKDRLLAEKYSQIENLRVFGLGAPNTPDGKSVPGLISDPDKRAIFSGLLDAGMTTEAVKVITDDNPQYQLTSVGAPDGMQQRIMIDMKNPTAPPIPVGDPFKGGNNTSVKVEANLDMGKPAQNEIEKKLINSGEGLSRLKTIRDKYKPEYQEIPYRFGAEWSALSEKFGNNLSLDQRTELESFSSYKRDAIDSINNYIKEITGAAMTNGEAERIMRGTPNPGKGIFDGDSPTQFKSKLDAQIEALEGVNLRMQYLRARGTLVEGGAVTAEMAQKYDLELFTKAQHAISNGANPDEVMARIDQELAK